MKSFFKIVSMVTMFAISIQVQAVSFAETNANEWDEKTVFISGEITNNSGGDRTVKFIFRDLLSLDEIMVVQLDENNSFQVSFPVAYPQDFYIEYGRGNLGTIFCSPGDTLFLLARAFSGFTQWTSVG